LTTTVSSVSEAAQIGLPAADGGQHTLASLAGRTATIVIFTANGCPTARAYEDRLMALLDSRRADGVHLVAINANNPYLSPPDTLAEMVKRAAERHLAYPYLKDADGVLARSFGAICTPHAFLLDGALNVVYSGRIDDSRLGTRITSRDLENAIADVVAGRPVTVPHTEPFGCSIVW
jgi:peroxiredoxin